MGTQQLSHLLASGGVAVVVGVRSTNVDTKFRQHPQLQFWQTTDNLIRRPLPSNTRVLITTRFIDHALWGRLVTEARHRNITIIPSVQGTGILRRILTELTEHKIPAGPSPTPVTEEEKEEVQTIMETAETTQGELAKAAAPTSVLRAKPGVLKAFLTANADLHADHVGNEARRLVQLAATQNIPTTEESVLHTFREMRRQHGLPDARRVKKAPLTAATAAASPVRAVAKSDYTFTPAHEPAKPQASDVAFISDAIAALELARDRIIKLEAENAELQGLKELKARLQALNLSVA